MILSRGREAFICSWFFVQKRWLSRNSIKSLQQLVEKESHCPARYLQTAFCVCHQHSQFPQLCDPSKHQKASNLITGKDQKILLREILFCFNSTVFSWKFFPRASGNSLHFSGPFCSKSLLMFFAPDYNALPSPLDMLAEHFFSASFCLQILPENQKTYFFFLLLTVVTRKELSGKVSV